VYDPGEPSLTSGACQECCQLAVKVTDCGGAVEDCRVIIFELYDELDLSRGP